MSMTPQEYTATMTERDLMNAIIDAATRLGYQVSHVPDGLYAVAAKHGRHDAMTGAKGFPDLLICGHGRVIAIETKSAKGDLTKEQWVWMRELSAAGVTTMIARPADLDAVISMLEGGET